MRRSSTLMFQTARTIDFRHLYVCVALQVSVVENGDTDLAGRGQSACVASAVLRSCLCLSHCVQSACELVVFAQFDLNVLHCFI